MRSKSSRLQSLNEWLVASLFFWLFLAVMEVTGALLVNGFPPPLGSGSMPTAMDAYYLVAALSFYALIGILTGVILLSCETIFSRFKEKVPSLDLNRMDLFLLLAFGLLYFKWMSQLLPYLTDADHLPLSPYPLIIPLLGVHLWMSGFSKKTSTYYRGNWIVIFFGTVFMSKTAYDLFVSSSLDVVVRGGLCIVLLIATLLGTRLFYVPLNHILLRRSRTTMFSAALFLLLVIGGIITTWRAVQVENNGISFPAKTAHVHNGQGKAGKNVILVVVDCLRPDHLECYGYGKDVSLH